MMIAAFHHETARGGEVYRAARFALLTLRIIQGIKRTDAAAEKVERMLTKLAKASALDEPAGIGSLDPRRPG
ncbi:hypothetical protein EFV37_24270 [Mesorhizobium loti]|uniref:Uncharacterized protein n=1 Tax=Mesorhizobium jarvisii TaxID=1777867 RepID=A0A6M7TLR0_9HYPH|nr:MULTISPECIES: hypothetical protein [Mesorhizobium]OBQ68551.1 hypothetical protein A9K72_09930 [Mesorhizobium loti]QKC65038.1 hypothetical protein EB229_24265 [Mesorhizobium jarvisii]QKD10952.1 hypothetical protein EFV37_24270 [Mesorhizobium loti]RJT31246.1 hypothetical protein D3242_23670 [Mesorhizobium jarvisii]BCH02501.1 hypothetical protein MesoLj131b_45000 [Mesorhizobium sp. 131-2-5]